MSLQKSPVSKFPGGKIINIQALRGIAVLLVVAYHLSKIETKYGHGELLLPKLTAIGMSGVDLFFVISGFVMVTVTRGWFQKQGSVGRFLYHRISRIYPTYWFYSLIVLAIFLYRPDIVNSSQGSNVNIISSFLLLPQDQLPLLSVGWTLIHEMYFYLVFALLLLFQEKRLLPLLLIWGILVAILPHENNAVLMLVTHPLTFEFIAGALIALLLQRRVIGGGWVAFAALPVWFLAYSFYVYQGGELEPDGWPRVMLFGIPSVLAVYGVVAMEMKSGRQFTGWLKIIGDASYSIYLSHLLVISAMGRIWSTIWQQGLLDNGVAMMAILLMVLIVGIISYRFLERPLMRLTRRYEGLVK
ncbi:MAG TPA: acyltransferase [Gammaproteobacteria bacterium]|nr:acyltransferase [Gammaproteobacteria bacterium]